MAVGQFGVEEIKQKIKSLRATCGGGHNKIRELHPHERFCTTSVATCLPVCKQHLHRNLPTEGGRQVTCPPDLSLYLPLVNAALFVRNKTGTQPVSVISPFSYHRAISYKL
jgi:hypothetical protein